MAIKRSYSFRGGSRSVSGSCLCLSLTFWHPLLLILPAQFSAPFLAFLTPQRGTRRKLMKLFPQKVNRSAWISLLAEKDTEKCVCRLEGGLKQQTNSVTQQGIFEMVLKAGIYFNQLRFTTAIKFFWVYVSLLSAGTGLEMGKVTMKK